MAHVERPTYTRSLPASAKVVGTVVTWVGRDSKPVRGTLLPSGKVRVTVAGSWVGVYTDHHGKKCKTKTYSSRTIAMEAALSLERRSQAVRKGEVRPDQPQLIHFADEVPKFIQYHRDKGTTPKECSRLTLILTDVIRNCDLSTTASVSLDRVTNWIRREQQRQSRSVSWYNRRVKALRAFGNWLVKRGATSVNPFAGFSTRNEETDRRRVRRAMPEAELRRLIDTTWSSSATRLGLSGSDRAMLYLVAAYTGLRARALSALTRDSLTWQGGRVSGVYSEARAQKNKGAHGVPLHPEVGERLGAWLGDRTGYLWPGAWHWHAAKMLAGDLGEAGIPVMLGGHVFDFHALRLQFGYLLAQAGVPLVVAQQLLDHSTPNLTANVYSRFGAGLEAEVARLPSLGLNLGASPQKTLE